MSLVDDVFGSLPAPLIDQWGIPGVYVKQPLEPEYDPDTGTFEVRTHPITGSEIPLDTRVNVSILPLQLLPEEVQGEVQLTDVKILIAADKLGDYYPKTADWIEYSQAGVNRTAKIIRPTTYRGTDPIFHSVIARLT